MPGRVLIVDDDRASRRLLHRVLYRAGYEPTAVETFAEGLTILERSDPDVLIADVRLGPYNGLQYVATNRRPIPTIIMTGDADAGIEREARELGAACLAKPFDAATLLATVKTLLDERLPVDRRLAERKSVDLPMAATADGLPVQLVDVSDGGMRLEIELRPDAVPPSFELRFPNSELAFRAEVVWKVYDDQRTCLCGASVRGNSPTLLAAWQRLIGTLA